MTASFIKKNDEQTSRSCSVPRLPTDPETQVFVLKTLFTCDQNAALTCCVLSGGWFISSLSTWVHGGGPSVSGNSVRSRLHIHLQTRRLARESRVSQSQEVWVRFPFLAITAWP